MNLSATIIHWITLLNAIVLALSAVIAFRSLKLQSVLKEMDTVMRFQDKYNRLIFELAPNWKKIDIENFSVHYWGLQADQFLYFQRKWVSTHTYVHWLEHRYYNFLIDNCIDIGGEKIKYSDLWENARKNLKDTSFVTLIDSLQRKAQSGGEFNYRHFRKLVKSLPRTPFAGGKN